VASKVKSIMERLDPVIVIVDDDHGIREALTSLLRAKGWKVFSFDSAQAFLSAQLPDSPSCLVLDLQLPGISGLELQEKLAANGGPPVVFISGHADIPSSVKAIKAGALEFLSKPFDDDELLGAIRTAIEKDREARQKRAEIAKLHDAYERVTVREKEVLRLLVEGLTNKQIAATLGIAEITVQIHRAQVMRKMAADSIPDLVRKAARLGLL
jgi:RNA polymerase sigma factor (sigma-70 family)